MKKNVVKKKRISSDNSISKSDLASENNAMKVVVNTVTTSRLLGAVALPFIYEGCGPDVAALCTLGLFASDALDGALARKFNASTFFGSILDVTSDKLLNFISFILLALDYPVMWAPIIMEMTISVTNYGIYKKGGNVKASKIGKVKTIVLAVCTILAYLIMAMPALGVNDITDIAPNIINILCAVITTGSLVTFIDYYRKYHKVKTLENKPKYSETSELKSFKECMHDLFSNKYYEEHKDEPIVRQLYK